MLFTGLAVSNDGITWQRGEQAVASVDDTQQGGNVGQVLAPNQDWWWHDTRLVSVSDVQVSVTISVFDHRHASLGTCEHGRVCRLTDSMRRVY